MADKNEFNGKCNGNCEESSFKLNDVVYRCGDKWYCETCHKHHSGCEIYILKFRGKLKDTKKRERIEEIKDRYTDREVLSNGDGIFVSGGLDTREIGG